jgi:hypothetical protein
VDVWVVGVAATAWGAAASVGGGTGSAGGVGLALLAVIPTVTSTTRKPAIKPPNRFMLMVLGQDPLAEVFLL